MASNELLVEWNVNALGIERLRSNRSGALAVVNTSVSLIDQHEGNCIHFPKFMGNQLTIAIRLRGKEMAIYSALSKKKIRDGVIASKDFKLSSMRGESGWNSGLGILPENWQGVYKSNREDNANGIVFTIFSYSTPIAWRLEDGTWIVPPVKYSATTTGHQSAVTYALSTNGWRQLSNTSWWER